MEQSRILDSIWYFFYFFRIKELQYVLSSEYWISFWLCLFCTNSDEYGSYHYFVFFFLLNLSVLSTSNEWLGILLELKFQPYKTSFEKKSHHKRSNSIYAQNLRRSSIFNDSDVQCTRKCVFKLVWKSNFFLEKMRTQCW